MRVTIIKARPCKSIPPYNPMLLQFHELVDKRLTDTFGSVNYAPEQIGQAWTQLKEATEYVRLEYTIIDRVPTPELNEKRKVRDKLLNEVLTMVDKWAGDRKNELWILGYNMQYYVKRIGLLKTDIPDLRDMYTNLFCHFTKDMPEYIAAVQEGKIRPVLEELDQINDECDRISRERFHLLWEEIPGRLPELRKQAKAAYRNLLDQINERLLELTILTMTENLGQASQMADIPATVKDKERLEALVAQLNDDATRYEIQAAEEKKRKQEAAEARRLRREQAKENKNKK